MRNSWILYILFAAFAVGLVFFLGRLLDKCETLAEGRAKVAATGSASGDEIGRMRSAKSFIDGALMGIYGKDKTSELPKHLTLAGVTKDFRARQKTTLALLIGVILGLLTRAPKLIAIVALVCAVLLPLMGSGLNRLTFPLDSLAIFVIACLDVRRRATRESRGTAAPDVEPA